MSQQSKQTKYFRYDGEKIFCQKFSAFAATFNNIALRCFNTDAGGIPYVI